MLRPFFVFRSLVPRCLACRHFVPGHVVEHVFGIVELRRLFGGRRRWSLLMAGRGEKQDAGEEPFHPLELPSGRTIKKGPPEDGPFHNLQ